MKRPDCPIPGCHPKEPDIQSVRDAIAAAVDAFCHDYDRAGREARIQVYREFGIQSAAMAESLGDPR